MNWLSKLFGKSDPPPPATKSRSYAGAVANRLTNDWLTSGASADSEILTSLRPLRNRSRELCRNNDYAKGYLNTLVNNVVGKGIALQAQVKSARGDKLDEKINTAIEDLWGEWSQAEFCHTAGKLCFSDIERLVLRSVVESGEVLVRLVKRSFAGSPVPLALEVIEADQLVEDWSLGTYGKNQVRLGVELDGWGRPVAYHLYSYHPGDYQFSTSTTGSRIMRVPAGEIIHLFITERPGQTRGVPWLHSALLTLRNLGAYEEAELVAARSQAAVVGMIESPDPEGVFDRVEGERIYSLEPGAVEYLAPGEKFTGFAPTRPNGAQGFLPFSQSMLRKMAAGLGISYEGLSRDFTNTSYSSARTSLIDERDQYRQCQAWLIKNFHQVIYKQWLEVAVLSGSLPLPRFEVNPKKYYECRWVARGWQWVDPQNEVAAYKEAIKAGFTTTTQVVAQAGLDLEEVLKERRRELDLAKELEIGFDTVIAGGGDKQQQGEGDNAPAMEGMTPVARGLTLVPQRTRKQKQCKKGISCGATCIAADKTCKSTLKDKAKKQKLKGEKKAKATTPPPPPPPVSKAGTIAEIDPATIEVDPKRFQYKILGEHTATGSVGSLAGVRKYDPNLAGILQVWEDPADGKTYVVNGHNRLDLAKKLGADKVAVRYLDVADDKEARAVGALTNIAEGRGNALDAAKFFRETGITREELRDKGIPMREAIARDGLALSKLEDNLFRKVIDGEIPVGRAALIGGGDLSHSQQRDLNELIEKEGKRRKITDDVVKELVDTVKSANTTTQTTLDLFGGNQSEVSTAMTKAELQAAIKRQLATDKKLFGTVARKKAAKALADAGNVIDTEGSKKISDEAQLTLNLFDQLKNVSGPISKKINDAATQIQAGADKKAVQMQLLLEIKQEITQEGGWIK